MKVTEIDLLATFQSIGAIFFPLETKTEICYDLIAERNFLFGMKIPKIVQMLK